MARRRRSRDPPQDEDELPDRSRSARSARSLSTRLAWLTLAAGAVLIATRVSVATVVQIHGDGMAPTLLDGEHVVLMRGTYGLQRGDIVVYDPTPPRAEPPQPRLPGPVDEAHGEPMGEEFPDIRRDPASDLRNTAVVDRDELEDNWQQVQARSGGIAARETEPLRLGRIIAVPGDKVTFRPDEDGRGLLINAERLHQKPSDPIRISLSDESDPSEARAPPRIRTLAYETAGRRRYQVLPASLIVARAWPGFALPAIRAGPVEVAADGYFILADNRGDGACCDSRAIGFVAAESIRGEVLMRLAGDASATPDLDPEARGFQWKP